MDKVVHFEIPTDDLARAKGFYGSVFGWDLQTMEEMDYTIVRTTPVDQQQMPTEPGGINGGMMKRTADTPAPVLTIGVASVDASLKQVEAAGGDVVRPKTEIPGMGSFA
jgi:predicted enzyme related to lactoylglutathione lyase